MSRRTQIVAGLALAAVVFPVTAIAGLLPAFLALGAGMALVGGFGAVARLREARREVEEILREEALTIRTRAMLLPQYPGWSTYWPSRLDHTARPASEPEPLRRAVRATTDCPRGHWGVHYLISAANDGALIRRECSACGTCWTETNERT